MAYPQLLLTMGVCFVRASANFNLGSEASRSLIVLPEMLLIVLTSKSGLVLYKTPTTLRFFGDTPASTHPGSQAITTQDGAGWLLGWLESQAITDASL